MPPKPVLDRTRQLGQVLSCPGTQCSENAGLPEHVQSLRPLQDPMYECTAVFCIKQIHAVALRPKEACVCFSRCRPGMQFPGSGNPIPIRPGGYSPLEFVQASAGRAVPHNLAQQAADFVRLRLAHQAAQGVSFGAPQEPVLQMAAPQDGFLQMMPHGGPHGCGHFAMAAGAAPQNPFAQMMAGALASGMSITMTLNPPQAMPFALEAPPEAVPPRQTAPAADVQTPARAASAASAAPPPQKAAPTVQTPAPAADVPPQKAAATALPQKAAPTADVPPQKAAPTALPQKARPRLSPFTAMTLSERLVKNGRVPPKPVKVKMEILKNKHVVPKLRLQPNLARPPAHPPPKAVLRVRMPSTVPRRLPTVPKCRVVRPRTAEPQQPPDDMFGEAPHPWRDGDMEFEEPPPMEGPAEEPEVWDDEHAAEESEEDSGSEPEAEELEAVASPATPEIEPPPPRYANKACKHDRCYRVAHPKHRGYCCGRCLQRHGWYPDKRACEHGPQCTMQDYVKE